MADEYETRTFVGDPNPAPTPKNIPTAPVAAEVRPMDTPAPTTPAAQQTRAVMKDNAAAEETEGEYWLREEENGSRRIFLTPRKGDDIEIGAVANPDVNTILEATGRRDAFGNWVVPKDVALSLKQGKLPFPEFIAQQYASGNASVRRGGWFSRALRNEVSFADAAAHGEIERQKMLENERPDLAWSEAPFGRLVAEARYVAGAGTSILPFMKEVAVESAGGAAILGGAAMAIVGTGGVAAPAAVPLVAGMMGTGASYKAFKTTMDVEGGNIAGDMYAKGFSEKSIRTLAPAAGALVGAMELTGLRFLTAPLKRQFVKNVLASDKVQKVMAHWLVNYGKELGAEVGIEVAQETVSQMTNQLAAVVENRPELLNKKEDIWNALVQTAVASTAGMAAIKLPGVAMDYAGSRATKAGVKAVKTAEAAGELDTKTASVAKIEGLIAPEIDATKLNDVLKKPEGAMEFGKKNAQNENVKAALHAKAEALKIKVSALTGGKPISSLAPEVQDELVALSEQSMVLNAIGEGMDASIKEEPMVPLKEPKTVAEAIERKHAEKRAVLTKLERESKALEEERVGIEEEIAERIEKQQPIAALDAAVSRLTQKITQNDLLAAEIYTTPALMDETLAEKLGASGAEGIMSASEIVASERDTVERIQAARRSYFRHGAAYAKREVQRVQKYIQELVKRSGMDKADQSKFISVLRNTQTVEQLETAYPEIRDRIFVAEEIKRAKASEQILAKALKAGKVKNVDGKPTGKFGDADTQAIVNVVTAANKMTRSQALMETVAAEAALNDAQDIGAPDYSPQAHAKAYYALQAARFRAGQMATAEGAAFVSELTGLLEGARSAFLEKKIAEREARLAEDAAIVEEILGGIVPPPSADKARIESGAWVKGLKIPRALIGAYEKGLGSIHSVAHLLAFRSGKKRGEAAIEKLLNAHKEETKFDGLKQHWHDRLTAAAERAYGIKGSAWAKAKAARQLYKRLLTPHAFKEMVNAKGDKVSLVYTLDEAIKFYMELQDPTLAENITHQDALAYTPEMIAEVVGLLSDGDKRFAQEQLQLYRELYADVNKVYREVRGVDLPFNNFYSPIKVLNVEQKGAEVSLENAADQVHAKSTMGNWAMSRVRHLHPLAQQSSLAAFNEHIYAVTRYVAYEAKIRRWNALIGNPAFRNAVVGVYGEQVMDGLRTVVQRITKGSHERAMMRGFDQLITKLIVAEIIGKPLAIAKQFTSMPAFANAVPAEDLHLFAKELALTVKAGKFEKEWLNSDFVKARGMNQSQDLKAMTEYSKGGSVLSDPRIVEALGSFVKFGDRASIMVGGNALFRYLRSKGVSAEEAVEITSQTARETQSSGSIIDLSPLQSAGGLARLFTAYMNQPVQFIRIEVQTLTDMASKGFLKGEGRISRADAVKSMILFHVVLPSLFQMVVDAGWDEEKQKRALILGSFNSIPLLANLMSKLYHVVMSEEGAQMGGGSVWDSWERDIVKGVKAFKEADDLETYAEALELLANPTFKAIWGIPTKPFFNVARGAKTILEGDKEDFLDAFKLVVGYSPYMIEEQNRRD